MGQFLDLVIYQGNVSGIHGNIGTDATHCDTYISFLQCRSVVDAVTDHANGSSSGLICFDVIQLIFRQAVGVNLIDTKLCADGCCCVLVVTGQ